MLTFFSDIIFATTEMYLSVVKRAAWSVLDNNLILVMRRKRMVCNSGATLRLGGITLMVDLVLVKFWTSVFWTEETAIMCWLSSFFYGTHLLKISSTTLVIIVYFDIKLLWYLNIHDIVNSFTTNLIQSHRIIIRMSRYTRNILLL